jgi:hypothetical protein
MFDLQQVQLVLMIHLSKPGEVLRPCGSAATFKASACQQDGAIPLPLPMLTILHSYVFRSVEGFRYTCQGSCGDDSAFRALKIMAVARKEAVHSASSASSIPASASQRSPTSVSSSWGLEGAKLCEPKIRHKRTAP